jgi:N-acetylglutamate synthase
VTTAPDGTRWVGMSAMRVTEKQRRRGQAPTLCSALLAWGAAIGATRGYVQVLVDNAAAIALYQSLGFTIQHGSRYVDGTNW